jgi:hypothetical protein
MVAMLAKFAEAFRLLGSNFVLFSAIILTVWLPGNIFANYLTFFVPSADEFARSYWIGSGIELIFGPIYIGALIDALSKLKAGERPGYVESITVGFRTWGRLFVVQLLASILIGLAFVFFLIPGIVLTVRYALINPVVVLEGARTDRARRRSTELTRGARWQIFAAGLLYFPAYLTIVLGVYSAYESFPNLNNMAAGVALDCVIDVAHSLIQIIMFLYYWQAVERERAKPVVDDLQ